MYGLSSAAATTAQAHRRVSRDWHPKEVSNCTQLSVGGMQPACPPRGRKGAVLTDLEALANVVETVAARAGARIVGFTSATRGEGVSTCAAVVSFLLAAWGHVSTIRRQTGSPLEPGQQGHAGLVVLVDAHLGDPFLHDAFALPISPGLRDWLPPGQSLTSVAHRVKDAQLLVLPAGKGHGSAGVDLPPLATALQELAQQVRLVVVDLPPILRAPEGVRFATVCDAVVLVVRAHHTRWEAVQQAQRVLDRAGVPILGAVLNRRRFDLPRWLYERL